MSDAVCGLIAATSRQFESAQAASARFSMTENYEVDQ
jgi:hypothetical protein